MFDKIVIEGASTSALPNVGSVMGRKHKNIEHFLLSLLDPLLTPFQCLKKTKECETVAQLLRKNVMAICEKKLKLLKMFLLRYASTKQYTICDLHILYESTKIYAIYVK